MQEANTGRYLALYFGCILQCREWQITEPSRSRFLTLSHTTPYSMKSAAFVSAWVASTKHRQNH